MMMFTPKKISCAVLVALMLNSQSASAGAMQDMWMSNSTPAGPVTTKTRSGWSGGSASYRTPIKSIQLFNISAPKVSAGCAGADIYMGSFSYINEQQIISTLQAIMQNAQGLIFQAAIEFVSPMISGLMKNFNDLAQKINGMAMNSCEIATSMMGPLNRGAREYGEQMKNALAANATTADWLGLKTNGGTTPKSAAIAAEDDISKMGNLTWKGLKNAEAGKKVDIGMFPLPANATAAEQYTNEVLMSFLGTQIITSKNSAAANASTAAAAPEVSQQDALLSLFDLVGGKTEKFKYVCDEPVKCLSVTQSRVLMMDAKTYVKVMIYGDPSWASLSSDEANTKLNSGVEMNATVNGEALHVAPLSITAIALGGAPAGTNLTPAQISFMRSVNVPIVNLITELKAGEYSNIKELTSIIEGQIAYELVLHVADGIINSLTNLESSTNADGAGNPTPGQNTKVELPEYVVKRKEQIGREMAQLHQMIQVASGTSERAKKFIDTIKSSRVKVNHSAH